MVVRKPVNGVPGSRWTPPARAQRPGRACPGRRADGTPFVEPGLYLLTRAASAQFAKPITVRVIRERTDRPTYHGWTWIEAYQLDAAGDAIAWRELFVMPEGLRPVPPARRGPGRPGPARGGR
ncbi:hypothetical protein Jiend_56160 [Micromonospora endophytica]|uniref:hypothetical protein n=1 Tax=Micromonospora endophytica TaxID=515350 RepID=UPI001C32FCE8|nr:hypothetical protein [Micromonospora endophytica]BCJ62194.1 hypothetical protein Jiend_56160 [Micromonospora endophytica]